MEKQSILVVDDEESICEILKFNLEAQGYNVEKAYSAEEALKMHPERFSLILLDIMMGEMSGFQMARILKEKPSTARVPIIFCTAKDTENDTIAGLDIGADDYISKPFSLGEVLARVRSVLRRSGVKETPTERLKFDTLELNLKSKQCTIDGKEINLTKKEFEILVFLLTTPDVIFSREQILKHVWGTDVVVLDRTIDVNMTRLRHKLGRYGDRIITRTGYGYGFKKN